MPVEEPIVATKVERLLHVPPVVASLSVVVAPAHSTVVPVITAGGATIVTLMGTRGLSQPAIVCVTHQVNLPTTAVDGVGAVELPTPPVAAVYHFRLVPTAVSRTETAPWQ